MASCVLLNTICHEWYTKSGALELEKQSIISYEEYKNRSLGQSLTADSLLLQDRKQIELDIPRLVQSLHKFVVLKGDYDAEEWYQSHCNNKNNEQDKELPIEPVAEYMDTIKRILLAYSVVSIMCI